LIEIFTNFYCKLFHSLTNVNVALFCDYLRPVITETAATHLNRQRVILECIHEGALVKL